jgi:hypothetical protein
MPIVQALISNHAGVCLCVVQNVEQGMECNSTAVRLCIPYEPHNYNFCMMADAPSTRWATPPAVEHIYTTWATPPAVVCNHTTWATPPAVVCNSPRQ